MKKVSVVVPTYNVGEFVEPLFAAFQEVEKQLDTLDMRLQLICVDDGSRDETWMYLLRHKAMIKDLTLIKLTRNFGAICASNAGLKQVEGDCFTIFAADLQDPLYLITDMASRWKNGTKYIIARRAEERGDPMLTKLYAGIFYRLVKFFVTKDFPKGGFDIAFYDRSILPYLQNTSKNINRSIFSHWLGYKPEVIVYDRPKRQSGKSGWSFSKKWKLFLDSILGFSVMPIRFISSIGIAVSAGSFIYGIVVLIGAMMGKITEPGFATVTALLTFLLGLIIVMLGVIGEYLWRIFDEVNKRPESVTDIIIKNE
jgi:polyisoprenyl-phosphate glycosyltransferase